MRTLGPDRARCGEQTGDLRQRIADVEGDIDVDWCTATNREVCEAVAKEQIPGLARFSADPSGAVEIDYYSEQTDMESVRSALAPFIEGPKPRP